VRKRSEPASCQNSRGTDYQSTPALSHCCGCYGCPIAALMTVRLGSSISVAAFLAGIVRKKLGLTLFQTKRQGSWSSASRRQSSPPVADRANRRPDSMQTNVALVALRSTMSVEIEIRHLRGLDLNGSSRWHSVLSRQGPSPFNARNVVAVLGYSIQADILGISITKRGRCLDRNVLNGNRNRQLSRPLGPVLTRQRMTLAGTVMLRRAGSAV